MSRAAVAKSRTEKKGGQSAATPAVAQEIIPGKYTDHDWNLMLDKDDGEEFVQDLVDEIVDVSLGQIYDLYLQRQLLPFTIEQAKDAILQIVEWQFLARDEGEVDQEADTGWIGDEEPEPVMTDCWAQGSVPKTFASIPEDPEILETEQQEESLDVKETEDFENAEGAEMEDKVSETADDQQEIIDDDNNHIQSEPPTVEKKTEPLAKVEEKKRTPYRPRKGPLRSAGVGRMTESLEQTEMQLLLNEMQQSDPEDNAAIEMTFVNMPVSCHSLLKAQNGRPPGIRDVTYDKAGNVIAVVKLNPRKLPTHRAKVKYEIVDPQMEAAASRLDSMRRGHRFTAAHTRSKPVPARQDTIPPPSVMTHVSANTQSYNALKRDAITPLPPPMIENIEVAPGVLVKEGGRVRRGPVKHSKKDNQLLMAEGSLRPIASHPFVPPLDVQDILQCQTPVLRPIIDMSPIPPILPHPPLQPRVISG